MANKKTEEIQPKLAGIEILKFKDKSKEIKEKIKEMNETNFDVMYNNKLITRYAPILDLKENYVVRVSMMKDTDLFEVVDPNEINPLDQFELTESVTQILKKFGLKAVPLKDEKEMEREAFEAGKKRLKEIQENLKNKIKLLKGDSSGKNRENDSK